ncbi:hypothetical protein BKA81DRAFT_373288 [Phyllosticta paracitricarpa]
MTPLSYYWARFNPATGWLALSATCFHPRYVCMVLTRAGYRYQTLRALARRNKRRAGASLHPLPANTFLFPTSAGILISRSS